MKTEIFGIKFDDLTMEEAIEKIHGFVILPYSEFVVKAQKNEEFRNILNKADFCLCEGRGLWLIARLLGKKLKQNINGIELIKNLKGKIFLFGGTKEVVEKTKEKLGQKIVGAENGYQDFNRVIEKINLTKPEVLLVGLGSPKQEKFIYENLSKMPSVKLAVGVGGAFDFISGRVKRAPKILQKIGMEWLWRLFVQPQRIKRIFYGVGGLLVLTIKNML
jgi:N-acetylglucosaminyldiphosphoundecaprenol N-acetyl-beta-D-mannosaminyltransferase